MSDGGGENSAPSDFDSLAASRRDWIENTLRAWCRQASLRELRKAESEWFDLAGRADPAATLWTWAWERFPDLVHPELPGVHETHEVRMELTDDRILCGFPDNRASGRGMLVLLASDAGGAFFSTEPVELDRIRSVRRIG